MPSEVTATSSASKSSLSMPRATLVWDESITNGISHTDAPLSHLPKLVYRIAKSFQRNLVAIFLVKIAQSFRERHIREIVGNDYQVNIAILPLRCRGPRTGQYCLLTQIFGPSFLTYCLTILWMPLLVGNERHLLHSESVCAYSI